MQRQQERVIVRAEDGNTLLLIVRLPTEADLDASRGAYDRAFRRAVKSGAMTNDELRVHAWQNGVWGHVHQETYDAMLESLADDEQELRELSRDEARVVAERMRRTRREADRLHGPLKLLESATAEALAGRAQFAAMLMACTTDADTGRPFFTRRDERHPAWHPCQVAMCRLLLNVDETNDDMLLPAEDRFLLKAA